jgi:hypothetical protein
MPTAVRCKKKTWCKGFILWGSSLILFPYQITFYEEISAYIHSVLRTQFSRTIICTSNDSFIYALVFCITELSLYHTDLKLGRLKNKRREVIDIQIKFMKRTAGYTLSDSKLNEDVFGELNSKLIINFIQWYRKNWKQHVRRTENNIIPKQIIKYRPRGKRNLEGPVNRWHETVTCYMA